ncbi:MAG: hypothetical protein D6740_07375 [Alphaproteobacteria bacterium]|nr:MAG: hypothetical protein D6740_07375 [Alphaproteobacteria bacterium]
MMTGPSPDCAAGIPLSPFGMIWQARQREGGAPVLPFCEACNEWIWPAQSFCPGCLGETLAWRETSGRGRLLAAVALHRGMAPDGGWPSGWTVGLVVLEEGPCVWSHLGRQETPAADGTLRIAVSRDRRGRLVLVAASDSEKLEEVSASLAG